MKHAFTLMVWLGLSFVLFSQQQFENILFASDEYRLSSAAKEHLSELSQRAESNFAYRFILSGHTDSDGDQAYNQALAEKRCQAVRDYLLAKGISPKNINIAAQGELQPIASNHNENGKAKNRRVEISLEVWEVNNSEELYQYFEESSKQVFRLTHTSEPQVITGKDGSKLSIPPNAFQYADGSPLKPGDLVELDLDEAVTPSSMIKYRLNTADEKNRLSTGGMIRLEARVKEQSLVLRPGKAIAVSLPKTNADDMNIYQGQRKEDGTMQWALDEQAPAAMAVEFLDFSTQIPNTLPTGRNVVRYLGELFNLEKDYSNELNNILQKTRNALATKNVGSKIKPRPLSDRGLPDLPNKPKSLLQSLKPPRKPKKPRRKQARSPQSIFKRIGYNKEKEQATLTAKYEAEKAEYEKEMSVYLEKLSAFEEKKAVLLIEQEQLDEEYNSNLIEVQNERKAILSEYLGECIQYELNTVIAARLKSKNELFWHLLLVQDNILLRTFRTQMGLDIKSLNRQMTGEKPSEKGTTSTSAYEDMVERALREYVASNNSLEELRTAYNDELHRLHMDRNKDIADDLALSKEVTDSYNFNITIAAVWWNVDKPIPFGKAIVNFSSENIGTNSAPELFVFDPVAQTINYRTKKQGKRLTANENATVYFIAFDLDGDKSSLAVGKTKLDRKDNTIALNFKELKAEEIEESFEKMDKLMKNAS